MIRAFELVEAVRAYDPSADEDLLYRAYVYAMKCHGTQTRANGDPYFSHPLEVAGLLMSMRLDHATIATALLHDTVEDTEATLQEVRSLFGEEIADLVNGVTKLSKIELQSARTKQAENFRKLVLAMSRDIRVLLVKLADRLHNMRTLGNIPEPRRRARIAKETMEIYAPLAERIGMQKWHDELTDLAFTELNGEARVALVEHLERAQANDHGRIERITAELHRKLDEAGLDAEVSGRGKSVHSIWQKMQRKNVQFDQLADVMAFRIIVESIADCYHALGLCHAAYPMLPGRFKDFISTPKPNGYRSLHTGVIGPERERIEIQIRTREMHEIAEFGVAAHWRYKQGDQENGDGPAYAVIRSLLDILEAADGPEDFLEHTKLDMHHDKVFCLTPRGDLIALPQGATPVDFAYEVHSAVGDECANAKVNGRIVPLRTRLQNGDQVEIIRSRSRGPSPEWERFVVTGKARARIRRVIKLKQRDEFLALGREIAKRVFREKDGRLSDRALEPILSALRARTAEDVYVALGEGTLTERDLSARLFPAERPAADEFDNVVPIARERRERKRGAPPVAVKGLIPGMAIHRPHCCHPLPGDPIVGIVTTGKGVTIHTAECATLETFAMTPERWIDLEWEAEHATPYTSRIHVVIMHEPGSLRDLTTVIARSHGNISNLVFTSRADDFFEARIDIEVADRAHLTNIMAALRAEPSVSSVDRVRA